MAISTCRACGRVFFGEPLLRFENMPKAAQCMPGPDELVGERGVDLEVCQCSGCGLVQLSGDPVPYYREVIRAAAFSGEMKAYRLKQFQSFVDRYALAGRRVLEVGCGRGEYLALMAQCGVECVGLEDSEVSVSHCLANGLKAFKGFVDAPRVVLPQAPYAAFYILNFLEHLPDPNSTLQGIRNNLAEGGVGIVEVPNFDMVIRKRLFSEFIGDHLAYFTKDTLCALLTTNGFEVLECSEIWYDYIISAVVRRRPRTDLGEFYQYQDRIKAGLADFVRKNDGKKIAVWGAGHQALALLSLSGIAESVRYVVDSAVFKQGKFTPATHRPIVSPDALDRDPVDVIIIMAGGYSDEVAGVLKAKYGHRLSVAIMRDFGLEAV